MVVVGGHPVAGLMANNPDWNALDSWTTYFHTADINTTVTALTEAGGSVRIEPMQVPAKGFMSMATDPTGAVFNLSSLRD